MAEMKNICGKIPVELHAKVRQEIEDREISTQEFIQQVIEEHFNGGEMNMAVRTIAVQVTEKLFDRLKAVVAAKGCKQKDFLIELIEKAVAEAEVQMREVEAGTTEEASTEPEFDDSGEENEAAGDEPEEEETEPETSDVTEENELEEDEENCQETGGAEEDTELETAENKE